jgi:hypothetical protein
MAITGLQALTSGFGLGTSLAGGAAKAGGLASLGFGPLAAITAIPAGLSFLGNTMAANTQRREGVRARNEAKRMLRADLGRQLAVPEFDFARQGFGQAFGGQLAATNPFISESSSRDTRSRMAISGANPYDIALAGRFMGA